MLRETKIDNQDNYKRHELNLTTITSEMDLMNSNRDVRIFVNLVVIRKKYRFLLVYRCNEFGG